MYQGVWGINIVEYEVKLMVLFHDLEKGQEIAYY